MTDADALLAAVLRDPDDDVARLVYADALDEAGDHDRAEFVRLQVEVAKCAKCRGTGFRKNPAGNSGITDVVMCCTAPLHRCDVLSSLHPEWCPECPVCASSAEPGWVHRHGTHGPGYYGCPLCTDFDNGERRGSGRIGTLRRGLLYKIEVPKLETVLIREQVDGDWILTPWARAFREQFPSVERIVPRDREPCNRFRAITDPFPERCAAWDRPVNGFPLSHRRHWLPEPVLSQMKMQTEFDDMATAIDALAESLAAVVKETKT